MTALAVGHHTATCSGVAEDLAAPTGNLADCAETRCQGL